MAETAGVRPRLDVDEATADQLSDVIAHAMGMRIAEQPSGNEAFPIKYRLHDKDGRPVGHPGGGFFGHGWTQSPEAAWFDRPKFATDLKDAWSALEWLRDTYDMLLVVKPYSKRIGSEGYRVSITAPIDEVGYTTGPDAPKAIAKAAVLAIYELIGLGYTELEGTL